MEGYFHGYINPVTWQSKYMSYNKTPTYKAFNFNQKQPKMTSTYRHFFSKRNHSVAPKKEKSRCFKNTYIVRNNFIEPRPACENNIVNRLYNELDYLYVPPRKVYSRRPPSVQCSMNQRYYYDPYMQTFENDENPDYPEYNFAGYRTCKSNACPKRVAFDPRNNNYYSNEEVNNDLPPMIQNNYPREEEKIKEQKNPNSNIPENYMPKVNESNNQWIMFSPDFHKDQVFNNYKPFLLDKFTKYKK